MKFYTKFFKLLLVGVPACAFGNVEKLNQMEAEALEKIDLEKMAINYDKHLIDIIDNLDKNSENYVGYLMEYYYLAHRNVCCKTIERGADLLKTVSVELLDKYLLLFCSSYNFNSVAFQIDKSTILEYKAQFLWGVFFLKEKILNSKFQYKKQHVFALNSLIEQYNALIEQQKQQYNEVF